MEAARLDYHNENAALPVEVRETVAADNLPESVLAEAISQYGPFDRKEMRGKLLYEMERADSKGKPVRRWVIESALDSAERARVRLWEEQQGMSDNDISMVCTLFGVDDIGMIPWHDGLSV